MTQQAILRRIPAVLGSLTLQRDQKAFAIVYVIVAGQEEERRPFWTVCVALRVFGNQGYPRVTEKDSKVVRP